ncbi:PLP-dependent aminotransferase family protein [Sphingobium boeckii]|uniref:DNA-binding transcriptional MocR family regulator n=1 Tax=Sphingobium boeckii TaxID=1082345 RepID=A0A7W9AFL8_9SPHN|nr:PLP-dependent aminotransferase family protein [Sphingobium boeckii]MBB5684611.1 DNA-binding transcriptional MocR family regulator [Sphingobium boeckii]
MQNWQPDLTDGAGAKYLAIASALSRDIEAGVLKPGDRLPPQRRLAEALDVDLTTVTKAYNEVRRIGLIEGGGRRGSFVRSGTGTQAESVGAVLTDTGMNLPPEPLGGTLAARMRAGLADLLTGTGAAGRLQYQPSGGAQGDRAAGAAMLAARGIAACEDDVTLASGGQNALHAILGTILSPGDVIGTTRFVYPGLLSLAGRHGLIVQVIASDAEGLDPDALAAACCAGRVHALYTVPTNDNPTTATMSAARRRAIAAVARTHGIAIIEDDAYGLLPIAPLPPMAHFAPELTWHIASLSKIISPALRVAYLRAPSIRDALRVTTDLHESAIMVPPLNAALASLWIKDGSLATLTAEVRAEAIARQAIARSILGARAYHAHPEGYHLWLPLPDDLRAAPLIHALRPAGLSIVSSSAFSADPDDDGHAVRISIGGGISRERLARTLALLDAMLGGAPGTSTLV